MDTKLSSRDLVVKDNRLIEASYRLDLAEQRLVLLAIAEARESGEKVTAETWLEVSAKVYVDTFGLSRTTGYKVLKQAADNLFNRWMQLRGIDGRTGKEVLVKTRWVSACMYVDQAALVRLQIAPVVIPYISNLESRFTAYQLKNVSQMTSFYAIRLYELLAQYKTIGTRSIDLIELKDFLGATEKAYERMDNFKKKVLDLSVNQVNQFTDLMVSYETLKSGRSISGYTFQIQCKEKSKSVIQSRPTATTENTKRPVLSTEISLGERALLRKIVEKTGRSESDILTEARTLSRAHDDVLIALDGILRNLSK